MKKLLFEKVKREGYYPVDFWEKEKEVRGFEDAPSSSAFAVKCTGYTEDEEGEKHPSDFSIIFYFDKKGAEVGDTGW